MAESRRLEMFVRSFSGAGPIWRISTELGGEPRILFEGRYYNESANTCDVAPDGMRFLMIKPDPDASGPAQVKIVLNWFEEVRRRVPGAR